MECLVSSRCQGEGEEVGWGGERPACHVYVPMKCAGAVVDFKEEGRRYVAVDWLWFRFHVYGMQRRCSLVLCSKTRSKDEGRRR